MTESLAHKFAKQFGAMAEIAEQLDKIGSLKQAGDEAKARLEKYRSEEDVIVAKRAKMVDEVRKEVDANYAQKREAADAHCRQKEAEGSHLLAKAKKDAAEVERAAARKVDEHERVRQAHEESIGHLRVQVDTLHGEIKKKKDELQRLYSEISDAIIKHREAHKKLDEARAALQ